MCLDSGPPINLTVTQIRNERVQASWTAPSNPVVDYRVFVNDANINGDGNIVASGTTYSPNNSFGLNSVVTVRVRTTSIYWSEVALSTLTIHGEHVLIHLEVIHQIMLGPVFYFDLSDQ